MATGGYNASFEETQTGFGNESYDDHQQENGKGYSGASATPLVGIDYKRHEDLKNMLDGNKDSLKLDAMKIIVGMVAKGRDCTDLFPAVVKNVVSKDPEIKKLVFVYLVRYAEEQQDVALLSISTFQKALKDPNQLIRASALRVLSSIRVPIIAPIMMLSIKDCVMDMSPYVRKTAANAIPKLYSLDPEQKEPLIEVIEKLLKDQTTLVAGSVVTAFELVCPERIDLIHKNYRKLSNLLVDVDEWGQVAILNMLTRYARSQFMDPNLAEVADEKFYGSTEESEEEEESEDEEDSDEEGTKKKKKKQKKKPYVMDADHRLLLRVTKSLLQSRNSAVVMAVAQLYHHVAPRNEVSVIARPLIRLLKGHYEVQSIVLSNIATLSAERPSMFDPYLKSFFVRSSDPTHIRLLKLDIMANLASETSIHTILREFRAYISSSDKQFAAATIQAIGRVACNISEVTETCLHGLMNLLSHKNEAVVAESVVVIKKLLQLQPKENKDLIKQVAKLADKVQVASAKASILWLVGEYCSIVSKIAPDVLRKAAKNFPNEDDTVKLQIMNLAAKLVVTNRKQTQLLCVYVLNLAKYDQNYDIRDRARFLKQLVLPAEEEETALSKYSKKILMASKPAPVLESNFKSRARWQLGSLSHYINTEANGYIPLPDFPLEAPDPSVRNVEDDSFFGRTKSFEGKKKKSSFFDDTDEETTSDEFYSSISGSEDSGSEEETESDFDEESEEESEEETEEGETSSEEEDALRKLQKLYLKDKAPESEEESEEEETSTETETETEETESSEEDPPPKPKGKTQVKASKASAAAASKSKKVAASNGPSLLDLDGWDDTPSQTSLDGGGDLLRPITSGMETMTLSDSSTTITPSLPAYVSDDTTELLNRISGEGLAIQYRFLRKPHISSNEMIAVELMFRNTTNSSINNITLGSAQLKSGMKMNASVSISQLTPGGVTNSTVGVNFNDTLQPAKFSISIGGGKKYPVQIDPVVGELLQAGRISEPGFKALQSKLTGMHEVSGKTETAASLQDIKSAVLKVANCLLVNEDSDSSCLRFSAMTFTGKLPLLVTIKLADSTASITVNCEKMVFGSMLLKVFKETIGNL